MEHTKRYDMAGCTGHCYGGYRMEEVEDGAYVKASDFDAYKEGSEEAFGAVVNQKRDLEEQVSRMQQTINTQQDVIVSFREQRDELLLALQRLYERSVDVILAGNATEALQAVRALNSEATSAKTTIVMASGG